MKERTQRIRYICVDFFSTSLAWLIFNIIRYYEVARFEGFSSLYTFLVYHKIVIGQIIVPFFWLILNYYSGYYNKPIAKSRLSEFTVTFQTVLIGTLILFFVILLNELPDSFHIFYEFLAILFVLTFLFMYFCRLFVTQQAARKIRKREWMTRALILGNGRKAASMKSVLEAPVDALAYSIQGYINTDSICPSVGNQIFETLGGLEDLSRIIKENRIDVLIVAIDTKDDKKLLSLMYSLYQYKLPVKLPISYANTLIGGGKIKTITGVPLIDVTDNNFSEGEKNIKHSFDKLVSFLVLLLLSPFYAYLVIRVKKDSSGPVFLKQERIGYLGKPFTIYKFRTMYVDAEQNGPSLSSAEDSRITKYGRKMRKYRFDELPQFWNVLKGDMSLVGPRPERKFYIDKIIVTAPYFYLLHNVRPGITSWGMVKYGYASTVKQMIERLQYDILYYENMSLLLDVKILIYTVRTVLTGKGI